MLALLLTAFVSAAGADGRYADPTGGGKGAPDIQGVNVTSDASGQITFRISVDSLPASPADVRTLVGIDSDLNKATGQPNLLGADYALEVDQAGNGYDFAHWNGSTRDDWGGFVRLQPLAPDEAELLMQARWTATPVIVPIP